MAKSGIEWTDRSDWNPVRGCTRTSTGCEHCYAEAIAARFSQPGAPFHGVAEQTPNGPRWTGKVELIEDRLLLPLKWRKPARIFVNSAFDLFHEMLPFEVVDRIFAVMALCPQHTFQVLTKRSALMRRYFRIDAEHDYQERISNEIANMHMDGKIAQARTPSWPLPNVWIGVTAENQEAADERIPDLLTTPAAVRWVSAEPLLGPVDFNSIDVGAWMRRYTKQPEHPYDPICKWPLLAPFYHMPSGYETPGLDWIVAGGESGPKARPSDIAWFRSLREQCRAAGVPFFMKQITDNGKKRPIELWPSDLVVREFPEAK